MLRNVFEASLYSLMVINSPGWLVMLILLLPLFLIVLPLSFVFILLLLPCILFVFPFVSLFLYCRDKDVPLLWVSVFAVLAAFNMLALGLCSGEKMSYLPAAVTLSFIHGAFMGWAMWWKLFGGVYRQWNTGGITDSDRNQNDSKQA